MVEKGIKWCNKNLAVDFPNFNFTHVPLNNDLYSFTKQKADQFVFPYADNSFEKVFLFSVFTHMQPSEIQNYLHEIRRVLKPKGVCLSTFFVYDSEIENHITAHNGTYIFPFRKERFRLMNEKVPSANIAFEEKYIEQMLRDSNLKLENKIYGTWSKRILKDQLKDFQDVLIFSKNE